MLWGIIKQNVPQKLYHTTGSIKQHQEHYAEYLPRKGDALFCALNMRASTVKLLTSTNDK
jgi:hypothetical protein